MTRYEDDTAEIKDLLKQRIAGLCATLLPNGKMEGRLWVANHPHKDSPKQLPALKIAVRGDAGAWRDYRSGEKGDVILLIAMCLQTDFAGAMKWARDWLGIRQMSRADRQALREAAATHQKAAADRSAKDRAYKLIKAQELFHVAHSFGGHPIEKHAFAYFAERRCSMALVDHLNTQSFRFSPATSWWKGAKWDYRNGQRFKTSEGPEFPAVHSALRAKTGMVTCCHVTFLDPLLPAKAPVQPAKLMYGEALGAVIEISTGEGGVAFWHETVPRPLILCEGIETGLAIAGAVPEVRVWAGASMAGMGAAPIDHACVSDLTVARDNNDGNRQALAQLDRCLAQLEAHGKPMAIMKSHVGDDFNDLTKGEEV